MIPNDPKHTPDARWLRESFAAARAAVEAGNAPFGAVLVDGAGNELLRAGNTTAERGDVTGHAEINAVREATPRFDAATLAGSTLYASTEPCAMCAAAIFWAGIGRVVFGMGSARLRSFLASPRDAPWLDLSCEEVLRRGAGTTQVIGPLLEDEAEEVHAWTRDRASTT